MTLIYNFIFLVIVIIYIPIYLSRRKFHAGFFRRLGILPKDLNLNRPIWIHAVSVGEVMAVRGLVEELKKLYPEKKLVISTVTTTGNKIAQGIAGKTDFVTYLPLDLSFIVRRVIDKINPSLFIIAETELWPNLVSYLYRKRIPSVTVNGRISDGSFRGYLSIKFLVKPILNKINIFCVQTACDAQRLMRLGVARDKINITGNMKFDLKDYRDLKKDYTDYRSRLGLMPNEKLLVAGSTHPGEEEIILGVYKELRLDFSHLKLLIAPRHPERNKDIIKIISRFGFRSVFVSGLASECATCKASPVFILDVMGQLIYFYSIADIVFVGGSLVKRGGHNILEPASLEKPILFGPYMFNFRDIAELFLTNQAAILVNNREQLKAKIKELLGNPAEALQLGQRAKELILKNTGATKRNLDLISTIV